jgi:hypothetical protein
MLRLVVVLLQKFESLKEGSYYPNMIAKSHPGSQRSIDTGSKFADSNEIPRRRINGARTYLLIELVCNSSYSIVVDRCQKFRVLLSCNRTWVNSLWGKLLQDLTLGVNIVGS